MFKLCSKCDTKMSFKDKFKMWNRYTYKGYVCEECNTKYKPTVLSMVIDFIIIWITYMFIFMGELHLKIGFIQSFILLIIVTLFTPAIVVRYKAID